MKAAPSPVTEFYARLAASRQDTEDLQGCIRRTIDHFKRADPTTPSRPGMLLGKVQSGKTRAFLGIIALAFDEGYEIAVVLTKGTKSLARQTVQREIIGFVSEDQAQRGLRLGLRYPVATRRFLRTGRTRALLSDTGSSAAN